MMSLPASPRRPEASHSEGLATLLVHILLLWAPIPRDWEQIPSSSGYWFSLSANPDP
jgi:hypothetical protein